MDTKGRVSKSKINSCLNTDHSLHIGLHNKGFIEINLNK